MNRPEFAPEPKFSDDDWDKASETEINEEPEFGEAILEYRNTMRHGGKKERAAAWLIDRIDYLIERAELRAEAKLEGGKGG